ncbi:MAG: hypothetical protein ABI435_04895, partial [Pseudolysinimonas sp.]
MPPTDWIEHRRGDGERVGWMFAEGDGFHVVDLLGRRITTEPIDWLDAETMLDDLGIGYLADKYLLTTEAGVERSVRIGEVSTSGVVVVADDWGRASAVGSRP